LVHRRGWEVETKLRALLAVLRLHEDTVTDDDQTFGRGHGGGRNVYESEEAKCFSAKANIPISASHVRRPDSRKTLTRSRLHLGTDEMPLALPLVRPA